MCSRNQFLFHFTKQMKVIINCGTSDILKSKQVVSVQQNEFLINSFNALNLHHQHPHAVCNCLLFIISVYPSHVARSEDAGLPKSFSMVSKVLKSTVNNLPFFFAQTQVSISTFRIHVDHKGTVTFLTVTGSFIHGSWSFGNLMGFQMYVNQAPFTLCETML